MGWGRTSTRQATSPASSALKALMTYPVSRAWVARLPYRVHCAASCAGGRGCGNTLLTKIVAGLCCPSGGACRQQTLWARFTCHQQHKGQAADITVP